MMNWSLRVSLEYCSGLESHEYSHEAILLLNNQTERMYKCSVSTLTWTFWCDNTGNVTELSTVYFPHDAGHSGSLVHTGSIVHRQTGLSEVQEHTFYICITLELPQCLEGGTIIEIITSTWIQSFMKNCRYAWFMNEEPLKTLRWLSKK